MSYKDTLVKHLRFAHGFRDYEPGGAYYEEGRVGFITPLDKWEVMELNAYHEGDHGEKVWDHEHTNNSVV